MYKKQACRTTCAHVTCLTAKYLLTKLDSVNQLLAAQLGLTLYQQQGLMRLLQASPTTPSALLGCATVTSHQAQLVSLKLYAQQSTTSLHEHNLGLLDCATHCTLDIKCQANHCVTNVFSLCSGKAGNGTRQDQNKLDRRCTRKPNILCCSHLLMF